MKLMFGIFILEKPTSSRVVVDVEYVINNKKYVNSGNSGDMALIKMKISVTFSNYILPICLPEQGRVFPNGKICVLTGWGNIKEDERLPSPMVLQEVGLPLINYTVCDAMFKKKFSDSYSDGLINSDMVCAGYPDGTKDGCQGDSGGPLACYADGHWLLVGIVSWGVGCATEGIGGVYTQVSNFTIWITSNTDLNETQPSETETKATTSQPPKAVVTTVTTPTTSQPPKPATTTKVCINQVTTAKPKKAAQSFNLTNDLSNSTVEFLQGDDPTDCGHRSSSPMSLLAVGLILTKI
ncbi:serine protease 27-like [Hyperolius riggenbachi]|uniref:serine protease 27-like n=1 Tax=Hyperolius riggenbachi TaxID=752182 RepID=UPI0035A32ACA